MNGFPPGLLRLLLALACGALIATGARAASVSFLFDQTFSGQAPAGAAPWLAASFTDTGPGTVRMSLEARTLSGAENIVGAYFNLDPTLNPLDLAFAFIAQSTAPQASSIDRGVNCCKADGDGKYDFRLSFPTGSGFDPGETLYYSLFYSGAGSFGAQSFAFKSAPAGGHGPFYAAAHVQDTTGAGSGGSGWISPQGYALQDISPVPLPGALGLLLLGLASLGGFARRRA